MTPARITLSAVVLGVGTMVVMLCGYALVVTPRLVAENPVGPPGHDLGAATGLVVFPLVVSAGLLGGLLLIWSGARGVRSADRPVLWCARQRTALWGCAVGALLAVFLYLFGDHRWTGLPAGTRFPAVLMLVCYSAMAFVVVAALALHDERPGRAPRPAARRRRPPSG